jgi:N,N-dimethylformamidase
MLKIVGYPDRFSVAPGETVNFKISVEEDDTFEARLVRVVHGDCNPDGPGLKFVHIPTNADGRHPGRAQRIDAGSFMVVPNFPALASEPFTFFAMMWPTLTKRNDQTLFCQWDASANSGIHVGLSERGGVSVTLGNKGQVARATTNCAMRDRLWYSVAVSIDPETRQVRIEHKPAQLYAYANDSFSGVFTIDLEAPELSTPLYLAGCPEPDGTVGRHFDGKLDSPLFLRGVHDRSLHDALLRSPLDQRLQTQIIAKWDFSRSIRSTLGVDVGPLRRDGTLVNLPTRGMKGWNWTGEEHGWTRKPEHYGAIHFHSDDVYDAAWETSVSVTLPDDIRSGPYALHVRCGESDSSATREDYLAFFVRPPRDPRNRKDRPKIAFLAPTCSYIAYANHAEHIRSRDVEMLMNRMVYFGHSDLYMYVHPELGGSLYDTHADGSGVAYSSRFRPILNFTAQYHSWLGGHGSAVYQYNADTHLFDWLEHHGVSYDVITDEDLHYEGFELIKTYSVIMTGTHPEYHSTNMWDAMKAWIDRGRRLMYMGGNGWYWRVAFHDELPGVIELRRAEDGIRPWIAEPGEYFHSFTGEYGGLWRRIGRAPNVIAGTGFVAQGFDISSYYRRAPDAANPRASFIFQGVPDEIIGDFGLVGGGAAGIELDCINVELGSPPNVLRLASSEGHSSMMMLVNEEFGVVPPNLGGDQNERVRADLAFYETPSGGAVFSTSSIAWCGALSHNGYGNNVAKITANVLKRFLDPKPFETTLLKDKL